MTNCRRPLASDRKITSRAKLLFRTVGQTLSLTELVIVRLNPDLRGPKRSSVLKGLQRHHPRKGKPVVRLGRKTKGHNVTRCGSLVAERMLAVVPIAA